VNVVTDDLVYREPGQMLDPMPLPMGRKEFDEWAVRIISGALVPNEDGMYVYHNYPDATDEQKRKLDIFLDSQMFALANMLLHLGPTESHKPDAFFIHSLRKFAVNQVADTVRKQLHEVAKARTKAEEDAKKALDETTKG
jgi:hypothetical protein